MLEKGDVVEAHKEVWVRMNVGPESERPRGPIMYVAPGGIHRVIIAGSGWQFKQEDVTLLYVDVDVSEFL